MSKTSDTSEAEFWQGLAANLALRQDQLDQLCLVVDKIRREIEVHKAHSAAPNGLTRRQRNSILRKICRISENLEKQVATLTERGDHSLTPILSKFLAQALTNDGIRLALGEAILWSDPRIRDSDIHRARSRDHMYSELEDDYRHQRYNVAHARAADLLRGFLRSTRLQIANFLELELRRNKGGSPGRIYRNHTIDRLAEAYPDIFRAQPTSTPAGRFMELCNHLLEHLGESSDGVESAVQRVLAERKR